MGKKITLRFRGSCKKKWRLDMKVDVNPHDSAAKAEAMQRAIMVLAECHSQPKNEGGCGCKGKLTVVRV